jgi:hypothetical protein
MGPSFAKAAIHGMVQRDLRPSGLWFALLLAASCASGHPASTSGQSVYKQLDDHLRADQTPIMACLTTPSGTKVNQLVINLVEAGVKTFAVAPPGEETEPARACLQPIIGRWRFDPPAPAPVELTISTEPFHQAQAQ